MSSAQVLAGGIVSIVVANVQMNWELPFGQGVRESSCALSGVLYTLQNEIKAPTEISLFNELQFLCHLQHDHWLWVTKTSSPQDTSS